MATDVLLYRKLDCLAPDNPVSMETIQGLAHGAVVKATISQPRNVQFHRKFFALVDLIYKNQSRYATREQVLLALKVATGYCDWIEVKGQRVPVPRSISFAKCDELQFQEFASTVFEWVVTDVMPGVRKQDLQMRLMDLTGDRI
jgi:hypothetical protein